MYDGHMDDIHLEILSLGEGAKSVITEVRGGGGGKISDHRSKGGGQNQ